MDIHVDDLATYVFLKNPIGRTFSLSLDGLETTKDLFFFMLDLFCKGLVLLYGKDSKTVDLTTIDNDKFLAVSSALFCAGIITHLEMVPDFEEGDQAKVNMPQLMEMDDNDELNKFVFKVKFNNVQHELSFAIARP